MKTPDNSYIAIIEYQTVHGRISDKKVTKYNCVLVGKNGKEENLYCKVERLLATQTANTWSGLTGFPVLEFKEVTQTVTKRIRIGEK